MALRKIRIQGEEILGKRAKEIPEITQRIKDLAADMIETMYDAEGVGLAAPQVGILKRIVVIDVTPEQNSPIVLINPVITATEGTQTGWEGCLSVPGKSGQVTRPQKVTAEYTDLDGNRVQIRFPHVLVQMLWLKPVKESNSLFDDLFDHLRVTRSVPLHRQAEITAVLCFGCTQGYAFICFP